MILWKNTDNPLEIIPVVPSYLEHCATPSDHPLEKASIVPNKYLQTKINDETYLLIVSKDKEPNQKKPVHLIFFRIL